MVESLRDEAARAYRIRHEKYTLSKAEQVYLQKIFNAVEITTPSYIAATTEEERTLCSDENDNDFVFSDYEGYKELLTKFAKKIKAIKRHNRTIQEEHPIMFRLGISVLDPRDLEAAFYYIKYHHYNFNSLVHEESTYAVRANDRKDRYKQFELDEEIYESEKASLRSSKPNRYNLSRPSPSPRANNLPQQQSSLASASNPARTVEEQEKLKRKKFRQSFIYSAKNIINMLKNTSANPFSVISSLRSIFENKIAIAKSNMRKLILKANKNNIIQNIHTGSLPTLAYYDGSEAVGIINHEQLKNLIEQHNLSNLPPTPQKPTPITRRRILAEQERSATSIVCPVPKFAGRLLYGADNSDDSDSAPNSIIKQTTEAKSGGSDIQQETDSDHSLSAQSLTSVLSKLKSSQDDPHYSDSHSEFYPEELSMPPPVVRLILSTNKQIPELSARRKISGNIAQIVNSLIESDKAPKNIVSKDSLGVDQYVERAKDKLIKLDNIIEKAKAVIKDIKSRGNQSPLKAQIKIYEQIITEATNDIYAIKHMARYNGLLLWSETKKTEYHNLSTMECIHNCGARLEDTPTNTPQHTPRSTPAIP